MEKYECDAQQRLLKVIDALVGHEVDGVSAKDIAARTGTSSATAFRDLSNLQLGGWAEQLEDGGWRLSVMTMPFPVPQRAIPASTSPLSTASPSRWAKSG